MDPEAPTRDTWDPFFAWPINDPYLESIRLEYSKTCQNVGSLLVKDINEEVEKTRCYGENGETYASIRIPQCLHWIDP